MKRVAIVAHVATGLAALTDTAGVRAQAPPPVADLVGSWRGDEDGLALELVIDEQSGELTVQGAKPWTSVGADDPRAGRIRVARAPSTDEMNPDIPPWARDKVQNADEPLQWRLDLNVSKGSVWRVPGFGWRLYGDECALTLKGTFNGGQVSVADDDATVKDPATVPTVPVELAKMWFEPPELGNRFITHWKAVPGAQGSLDDTQAQFVLSTIQQAMTEAEAYAAFRQFYAAQLKALLTGASVVGFGAESLAGKFFQNVAEGVATSAVAEGKVKPSVLLEALVATAASEAAGKLVDIDAASNVVEKVGEEIGGNLTASGIDAMVKKYESQCRFRIRDFEHTNGVQGALVADRALGTALVVWFVPNTTMPREQRPSPGTFVHGSFGYRSGAVSIPIYASVITTIPGD